MKSFLEVFLTLFFICCSLTYHGIDIVGPLSITAFGCLQNQNNSFAFVRAYQLFENYGDIDPNAVQTL